MRASILIVLVEIYEEETKEQRYFFDKQLMNLFMSLSEKTRKSNHLQMLEQRQHFLLNYFKTFSVGPVGNRTRASRTIDWHLTN